MLLHDAVGKTVKMKQLLKTKVHVSSKWAKECMFMILCVCVLSELT